METLVIRHLDGSSPPQFQVVRLPDGKTTEAVEVPSPFGSPMEGRPQSNLMAELRWYLERFLDYPFPPETDRAENIQDALRQWGTAAYKALFSTRSGGRFYDVAVERGHEHLCLQVSSDDPNVLAWPWEALHDPEVGFLAQTCQIERRLNRIRDPITLSEKLPKDRINILLVTARPYERDVRYRSLSRPLVELIRQKSLPAHVHVLRPPTFDGLREHLREHPHFYHILHFDGHGAYGTDAPGTSPGYTLRGSLGRLIFEKEDGSPSPVTAEQLGPLLLEYALPCVVLNACQSAMVDGGAEDPFASVAAALLRSGVRSIAAMAYSLYVSGGQVFLPAFYGRLFETGNPAQAMRAGRQQMFAAQGRVCARGRFPLQDWLVPVLYHQDALDLSFAAAARMETSSGESRLPPEARDQENPYGFIGRDAALLGLERAIRRRTPAVLIHGLGGAGKTTLVRGFLEWLEATQGLGDGAFWFGFQDIRSAEYVFNRMGEALFGPEFIPHDLDGELAALTRYFNKHPFFIVWDNFEVVRGIAGTEVQPALPEKDQALLLAFLKGLRGGKSKVLITSRSEEEWLGVERLKLSLGELEYEERWELCNAILSDLGIKINRDDKTLVELVDYLRGHPLAMRVILPRLEKLTAAQVLSTIKSNLEAVGPEEDEAQVRLFAALRFVGDSLPEDLRPLLIPLAFHENFAHGELLAAIAAQVDERWTQDRIDCFLRAMASAGLLRDRGQAIFEMHPALAGFLRSSFLKSISSDLLDAWTRAYVDVMGTLANHLTPKQLHEQRPWFAMHKANFYHAMHEAERLLMDAHLSNMLQALVAYAQNTRNLQEAGDLFMRRAEIEKNRNRPKSEAAAYHQLGTIAGEQRNFETARYWYLKSLEISEKLGIEHGVANTYHQLGTIAGEQRDFETARKWYLKSLEISEKHGNERGAASTYHQLGRIAEEQRDFETARKWYLKSLEISEKHGNERGAASTYQQLGIIDHEKGDLKAAQHYYLKSLEISEKLGIEHGAAGSYHQLGIAAQEQGDFETARKWYLKSLEISEKHGNERGAASTYHQLGRIAEEQRDFETARKWYLKSLEISEKHGNERGAASTYHQLGIIADEQRDFATARRCYLKSLDIKEKQGNEHGAAGTYGELGILEGFRKHYEESGRWLCKSIVSFLKTNDEEGVRRNANNFFILYRRASSDDQATLKMIWEEAGLGAFPEEEKP